VKRQHVDAGHWPAVDQQAESEDLAKPALLVVMQTFSADCSHAEGLESSC